MITLEQLHKFCVKSDPLGRATRHMTPFRFRGYIYATDGRICIRIKDDGTLQVESGEDGHIDYAKVFECVENCNLPLPALPERIVCKHCDGTCLSHDCPECEGEGCDACGTGIIAVPQKDAPPCWWCNGRGEQEDNPVSVGNAHFNRIFLALAAEMPGARFVSVNGYAGALIKFDGGEIAIMPTHVTRVKP